MRKNFDEDEEEHSEDTNVGSKDGRENLLDDDDSKPFEEAFMKGWVI